jgi:hypothetical protein
MKWNIAVVIFLISLTSSVLTRTLQRHAPSSRAAVAFDERTTLIKVVLAVRATDDWNAILWNAVRAAARPRGITFGILIECDAIEDAEGSIDSLLRPSVRVDYDVRVKRSPAALLRRLVRRFVDGDEAVVVVLHHKATLVSNWDELTLRLATQLDDKRAASAPPGVRGEARFPTLRQKSDGRVARETSRSFKTVQKTLVPSVCWCPEVTLARPETLRNWPRDAVDDGREHLVPAVPLLEEDRDLEEEMLDDDANFSRAERKVLRCETVGLAASTTDLEGTLKYGSVRAAKMATRFG